ncbi:hypothetical protein [uncultured Mucilaginibacter sp.]|uniref:hypothetical protein n=1 Tax=uncultured Mucilaginibacter sp. TaxID=797541 RepID=UPI0025CF2077|nr:hypothetical protein [uncultured Mucilaginibacter sp.]
MNQVMIIFKIKKMGNKIQTALKILIFTLLIIQCSLCFSQVNDFDGKPKTFCWTYDHNNDSFLWLGCIIYSKEVYGQVRWDDKKFFLEVTGTFQKNASIPGDINSSIEAYIKKNKKIDFTSPKATLFLDRFVKNTNIVMGLIFEPVESDNSVNAMKALENKILKDPSLSTIYKSYIPEHQDMSILSSGEGIALYFQMAYYLTTLDDKKNIQTIKALL